MASFTPGRRTGTELRAYPRGSIFLLSAAALAYEVLLTRLFSIIQWHHFAYMVISLALLGYGASGSLLTLARGWLLPRFRAVYITSAALFGCSAVACFLLAQRIPFNTLEILWDRQQWWWLLCTYLLLFVPFFFAASCVCLAFQCFGEKIPRIYSFDLLGAGMGSLAVILGLFLLTPMGLLQVLGMLGLLAAVVAGFELRLGARWVLVLGWVLVGATLLQAPVSWLQLQPSQYKELMQTLRIPGTRVLAERSSPLGWITVVESRQTPLRHAPGLSLTSDAEPPPQLGVFTDGDGLTPINRFDGGRAGLAFLDQLSSALAYHVGKPRRVLILGAGGGGEILQAIYHDASEIQAVELNRQMADLLRHDFAAFAGWQHLRGRVKMHIGEARGFVTASEAAFDLIQISLLDSSAAATAGVYALSESYLYTVEALQQYLSRLRPGGLLSITRWAQLPPRDGIKLFATAVRALRQSGVADPGARLVLIRSWKTVTLLVRNGPFEAAELERAKGFCSARSFDLAYYPGMPPGEANAYNLLPEAYYYAAAQALLGPNPEGFVQRYKFDVSPVTDDRPFFFNYFKWGSAAEILRLRGSGGMSLLELGYPVLLATLLQALVASAVLVLLPVLMLRGRESVPRPAYRMQVSLYFAAVGLAFLFLEIAFIQKFILFLSNPLYAVAVVLCGFLVFSGLGSGFTGWFLQRYERRAARWAVAGISLAVILYLLLLPGLFQLSGTLPDALKIVLSLLLIAPLAFCMGVPFPAGLSLVSAQAPALVPWAWAINGCASLISAVLATLVAIHSGFTAVVLAALFLYGIAAAIRL